MTNSKIKVILIDDSVTMQRFIQQLLVDDDELMMVAVASDPYEARDLIKQHNPDVLILDIEMPKMDGLTFLSNLMRLRPMPVVMNSSLSQKGAYETIKALEIGAVDYIGKPRSAEEVAEYKVQLINKVKKAAKVKVSPINSMEPFPVKTEKNINTSNMPINKLIAIGASTGGIEALTHILRQIPADCPPIVIVQHIPEDFSASLARRLDETCSIHVMEGLNLTKLSNNCAYIAPGGKQMILTERGSDIYINIEDSPPISGHKPSVDALFKSIARLDRLECYAAILTGMGNDGAEGIKLLFEAGAKTVVQDEQSSVVWGMPRSAIELEPKHKILPLKDIAQFLIDQ